MFYPLQVFCLVGNLFQNSVDVLRIQCTSHRDNNNKEKTGPYDLAKDVAQKLNLEANGSDAKLSDMSSAAASNDGDTTLTVLSRYVCVFV